MLTTCPACGQPVASSAAFCAGCGQPVPRACGRCGGPLSAQARFCGTCGADVAAPSAAMTTAAPPKPVPPTQALPQPPVTAATGRRWRTRPAVFLALALVAVVIAGGVYVLHPFSASNATPVMADGHTDMMDLTPPIPEQGDVPTFERTTPITGHLTLGAAKPVATQTIGAGGGTVAGKGLEIQVPNGALTADTKFDVKQAPITANTFGKLVTPISPLYLVDDGGAALAQPVTVKLPVKIPDGATAMAFSYDDAAGTITPLIPVSHDATTLTVGAAHFSGLFAGLFDGAGVSTTVDSGFRPGKDDWEFPNYGSYVALGGHCEGQSTTAIWYYVTQHLEAGAPSLSGLFDNNGAAVKTPDLWSDDSQAYRFVSSVHADPLASLNTYLFFRNMWDNPDDRTAYAAFWAAMALTGEPQLIRISSAPGDGGHTMIVYRITADRLFIADPNYPGRLRTIKFDAETGKFSPYSSGDNAGNIAANGVKVYTRFAYVPWQTSHSDAAISAHWAEFQANTAGDAIFPKYDLDALAGQDADGKDVWEPLTDGYTTSEKQLTIRISDPRKVDDVRMKIYRDTSSTLAADPGKQVTIQLKDGDNPLGILEQGAKRTWASWMYDDFVRLTVVNGASAKLEFDPDTLKDGQTDVGMSFKVDATGIPDTAKKVSFAWNFGDGATAEDPFDAPYDEPLTSSANHAFADEGDQTVTVVLYDTTGSTRVVLARATWPVAIIASSPSPGPELTVGQPKIDGSRATFQVGATGLPADATKVQIAWDFGTGPKYPRTFSAPWTAPLRLASIFPTFVTPRGFIR